MTSIEHWYSPADLPPGRLVVRVIWHRATFLAMRMPRGKAWGWATVAGGAVQWLPPAGQAWTAQPDAWQPQNPERWTWPQGMAPEPLPAEVIVAALASRADVSAVSAEPAAAEDVQDERLWWQNPANVVYEPAGECTERGVEGRLCRALSWCGAGQGLRLRTTTPATIIARLAERAAAIQDGQYDEPRFRPLPKDVGDFDTAMGWYVRLAEQTEVAALNRRPVRKRRSAKAQRGWPLTDMQEVLFLRAYDSNLTWETIGAEMRVSYQRAQQLYDQGLEACWRVANGRAPFPGRPGFDQIKALRERNRLHKLAESLA